MGRIAVIGLGNVLLGDDGVGPYAVRALEAWYEVPREVDVLDAGTPGMSLAAVIADLDAAVLVDAVVGDGLPGEVRLYDEEAILGHAARLTLGPHDPGLREALLASSLYGERPRQLLVVGVVASRIADGPTLSPPVRAAVPTAVAQIVAALARVGVEVPARAVARTPDVWWEARALSRPPARANGS